MIVLVLWMNYLLVNKTLYHFNQLVIRSLEILGIALFQEGCQAQKQNKTNVIIIELQISI